MAEAHLSCGCLQDSLDPRARTEQGAGQILMVCCITYYQQTILHRLITYTSRFFLLTIGYWFRNISLHYFLKEFGYTLLYGERAEYQLKSICIYLYFLVNFIISQTPVGLSKLVLFWRDHNILIDYLEFIIKQLHFCIFPKMDRGVLHLNSSVSLLVRKGKAWKLLFTLSS